MTKKIAICPLCQTKITCVGKPGEKVKVECQNCGKSGSIVFKMELKQLDFYPINEPFAYAKMLKDQDTLEKSYKVIEPFLNEEEQKLLNYIWETLLTTLELRLDELDLKKVENYLIEQVDTIFDNYQINIDDLTKKKILYYIKRESLGYGKIDPLMKDPNIEDISCDGSGIPIFLYHRKYGSLKSNVYFTDEEELSYFVVRLAQKCGKHISIAEPMLDATIPDGSRIQMTLSTEVTTKGSTFTIRRFKADPITPPDLISFNTVSSEILAYFWLGVENRVNALIAGGTASGKTTVLNALSLFIPRESKIVSIEETREINLPHPNWIPGVSRSGFGEIVADKMVGEIDLYDLMKAALRQRPEYILVGEIRGKEAYVLFQAMATGHATYSTVHADSAKSLIHRLEGKPIDIPRVMLQSLDIVSLHVTTRVKGKRVRRCKQIIEILDVDPTTKEILTNEVFRWDPIDDKFIYTGKSYVLEGIRARWDISKEEISEEIRRRAEILEWMKDNEIRSYDEVSKIVSRYNEKPDEFYKEIKKKSKKVSDKTKKLDKKSKHKKKEKKISEEESTKTDEEISKEAAEEKESIKLLKSIDDKTAEILSINGITTIEKLINTSKKDLLKIKGVKKKIIRQIFKEIKQQNKREFKNINHEEEEIKTLEPEKETEESEEEPANKIKKEQKQDIEEKNEKSDEEIIQKIRPFEAIKSINEKIAIALYDNGIKTIDDLKKVSIKDLSRIEGINKKIVKKIIKDLKKSSIKNPYESLEKGGEMDATE